MGDYSSLINIGVTITTVCGAWLSIKRISRDNQKEKKRHAAEIVQIAKEADSTLRIQLENRIQKLEVQLDNLKESVNKDMNHLKEVYEVEFKSLADRIESIRSEIKDQGQHILTLLTKLVDKD